MPDWLLSLPGFRISATVFPLPSTLSPAPSAEKPQPAKPTVRSPRNDALSLYCADLSDLNPDGENHLLVPSFCPSELAVSRLIIAPSGAGKTRFVQIINQKLIASRAEPPYRLYQLDYAKLTAKGANTVEIGKRMEEIIAILRARHVSKTEVPVLVLDDAHKIPTAAYPHIRSWLTMPHKDTSDPLTIATTTPEALQSTLQRTPSLARLEQWTLPAYTIEETMKIIAVRAVHLVKAKGLQLMLGDLYDLHFWSSEVDKAVQPAGSLKALEHAIARCKGTDLCGKLSLALEESAPSSSTGRTAGPFLSSTSLAEAHEYARILPRFLKSIIHGQPLPCELIGEAFDAWMSGESKRLVLVGPAQIGKLLSIKGSVGMCAYGFDPLIILDAEKSFDPEKVLRDLHEAAGPILFIRCPRHMTPNQNATLGKLMKLLYPPDKPEGTIPGAMVILSMRISPFIVSRHTHRGVLHPIGELKIRAEVKRELGDEVHKLFDQFAFYVPPDDKAKFDFLRRLVDRMAATANNAHGVVEMSDAAIRKCIEQRYAQDRDESPFYPWAELFIRLCNQMMEISGKFGMGFKGNLKLEGELLRMFMDLLQQHGTAADLTISGQSSDISEGLEYYTVPGCSGSCCA